MSEMMTRWGAFLVIVIGGASIWSANCAHAQVTPDGTLPNNSNVQTEGNTSTITGGTQAGGNLFHSFRDFSVPTNGAALFNNALDIQNIISRVTGKSISEINGLIRANGTANLFLINPNGIIFGQNARLDIGGSFVGSTASSLKFADGFEFSATNPQSRSLLTISVPIGLQYGANPGSIQVQGDGQGIRTTTELIDTTSGLRVQPNQTLAMVGGDVSLEGATLKTAGGRIELGSVAENGLVSLTPINKGFALSYDGVQNFGNIQLSQQAAVDASGAGGGDIQVVGRRVTLSNGSTIEASTLLAEPGGAMVVNATELIEVIGISTYGQLPIASSLATFAYPGATGNAGDLTINTAKLLTQDEARIGTVTFGNGKAGDLTINTGELLIQNGAQVGTATFGNGKAGDLTVTADKVQLIGESANRRSASSLSSQADRGATGDAGDLTIKTGELLIQNGAFISVGTFGAGKGGNLRVDAQNVQLIGTSADNRVGSQLAASAGRNSTGDAGDLTIRTNTLLVRDGAQVSTITFGTGKGGNLRVDAQDVQIIGKSADNRVGSKLAASAQPNSTGDAGDLTVRTNTLLVRDGAQVGTNTFGAGKGGNLKVNAQDVQLIGTSADPQFVSGLLASAQPNSTGDAGDLTIKTNTLLVRDGAAVTVQSLGTGTAGNMTVNARSIRLNNNALLTANTRSAKVDPNREQATININSQNLIMSRNSNIKTEATGENVIGGNINIDTDFLVAFKNSDISANSANFRGGNVRINATGIFGTQFRDVASDRTSDITATGGSPELSGTVQINTPDIDLNSALINLPSVPVDTQVAQSCSAGSSITKSQFTITGRGGLPPNPGEALNTDAVQVDLITVNPSSDNRKSPNFTSKTTTAVPERIVEATDWIINEKGQVVLVANSPTTTPHSPWFTQPGCTAS
ncbi:MAG: S-layer family protein [Iphinoe sp. HA4291-MV1]|jgi:filamentous hemagglutinin family protein|nr:S-layer family protein [Iphinoe sp. HA4291-MV1]